MDRGANAGREGERIAGGSDFERHPSQRNLRVRHEERGRRRLAEPRVLRIAHDANHEDRLVAAGAVDELETPPDGRVVLEDLPAIAALITATRGASLVSVA